MRHIAGLPRLAAQIIAHQDLLHRAALSLAAPAYATVRNKSLAVQTFAFVLMAFQCVLSSSLNPLPKQGGLESLSVKTQAAKPFSPSAPSVPAVIKPDSPLSVSTAWL